MDKNGDVIDDSQHHTPDEFASGPAMQRLRNQDNIPLYQHMTNNQMATYINHNGSSTKYDMISFFLLQTPELLGVFTNPIDYFRLCHIDEKPMNEYDMNNLLDDNIFSCAWIDF